MSAKKIALAYCLDNSEVAEKIDRDLSRAGYVFQHFHCKKSTSEDALSEQLLKINDPILLIVSDNFLKSAQCMHRGLRLLQEKGSRILPVVVDGVERTDEEGEATYTPTNFDRVSDIIQYINYWQDQYLDLRRQKRQMQDELDEKKFNAHLKVMREVSSEVGEFLRMLRNMYYVSGEDLQTNAYERFFRFTEDQEGWRYYQELSPAAPADETEAEPEKETIPSGIPGIELLEEKEKEPAEGVPVSSVEDVPEEEAEKEPEEVKATAPEVPPEEEEEEKPETEVFREEAEEIEAREIEFEIEGDKEEEEAEAEAEEEAAEEEPEETGVEELLEDILNLIEEEEIEEAVSRAADGLEHHPDNTELRFQYALLLARHHDDPDVGIAQLQILLEQDPENEEAAFLIGELAEVKGDYLLAHDYYEKVAKLNSDFPDVFYRLGVTSANHFPEKKELTARYFKKAVKKDPQNADASYQYGLLLNEVMGKPKKAIKYFQQTLEADPNHPFASYDLALLYHKSGKREKAFQAYQQAVMNNPEMKTPENDQAFHPRTAASSPGFSKSKVEHDTIEALKDNISRLEELLENREREMALAALAEERALEEAKPEPEKEPGPIVFITGATSGIGRATAQQFAENGYRLILNGRREDRLTEIKEDFEEDFDTRVKVLPFDVRDVASVERAIAGLDDEWRQVDILVNNAGKAKGLDPIHEGQLEHWEEMIDTNIKGILYLTRAIAPHMVERRAGHIINIGSTAGKEVYPKGGVYCATKFAVEALTKSMRLDLHAYNVRVSQVSPGHVEETEFALVRFDGDAERAKIYGDFRPLTSEDVAEAIYFMATRPPHVNVQDILMMGTQQASATMINRSGRDAFGEEE